MNLATLSNPRGELVYLALSTTESFNTLEAFAAKVPIGRRDVVAVKGLHSLNGNFLEEAKSYMQEVLHEKEAVVKTWAANLPGDRAHERSETNRPPHR